MATYEEFRKLELKVATIKEVYEIEGANKLYRLIIDVGDKTKQIVAGIKQYYIPQDLVGKQIVIIDNLEPAIIRGIESQGMLLAASDEQGVCIISPSRLAKPGVVVK
ncbi:MAG: methionine--tRNA ligase subunit beta [Candidatus Omnitrophota bacterium]